MPMKSPVGTYSRLPHGLWGVRLTSRKPMNWVGRVLVRCRDGRVRIEMVRVYRTGADWALAGILKWGQRRK